MGLRNRDATLKRNMDIIQNNLALLQTFFQKHAEQLQWCVPSGSSVAFPRLISGKHCCFAYPTAVAYTSESVCGLFA